MKISKTHFVELHYTLREENAEGKVLEETIGKEPLSFIFGVGMMIPVFEEQIEGMEVNDVKSFKIVAEDAYGLFDDDHVVQIPIENFGSEEQREEHLVKGKEISLQDTAGGQHTGTVLEITDEHVTIDFNHPLAGFDLFYEVEIVNIRETTNEELQQLGVQFEG